MGSCVSSSQNKSSSTVNLNALISKLQTTSSPNNNGLIASVTLTGNSIIDPTGRRDSGNKEEMMFYESREWLDSDCEDDFMSVDGGTPSQGTTPVHHRFLDQTPKTEEEKQPSSPIDNKKRLMELFKESQDENDEVQQEEEEGKSRACLWLRTPIRSSAPATPNSNVKERLKRVKSAAHGHGGCVTRLVSCSSFTERRRKMMSHSPTHVYR